MIAAAEGLLARRWRVVVAVVGACVGVVVLWGYLTPKHWQASVTVRLDPVLVPGLREDTATPATPSEAEAMAAELAVARGDAFQDGLATNVDYDFTLTVEPGDGPTTLRFTADADSAERSVAASYAGANGFLAWGRAQEAVGRQAALERERAALAADDPAAVDLDARIAVAGAALAALADGAGEVVEKPTVPDDPVGPDFTRRLLLAVAVGLVVGLAAAWWIDRRHAARTGPPEASVRTDPGPGAARTVIAVIAVAALAVPAAAVIAGVEGVWELRPSTNAQDEAGYACLPGWLDDLPDGTSVGMAPESPRFFADHLQEFAYPRLVVPDLGVEPEVRVLIVAGPGPEACGGYHRDLVRP